MTDSFDLICIGMALVDTIIKGFNPEPVSASGYTANSVSLNAGGEAVNEAIAASKLGLKTAILCALGSDAAGDMVIRALKGNGVYTDLIVSAQQTPITTMFVGNDGSRRSITTEAHRQNFHPENLRFDQSRAIILGSLFRAPFDDPDIVHSVLLTARNAGQAVFTDTKLPNFRKLCLDDLKSSLPLIDYITPNEDEARYYTGESDPERMADIFLDYGVKNVIIKLGPQGCILKNANEMIRLPGYRIDAVDATGAGDNFLAGFVAEFLRGCSNRAALQFANVCGAICTTAVGASAGLMNKEQVLKWMKNN